MMRALRAIFKRTCTCVPFVLECPMFTHTQNGMLRNAHMKIQLTTTQFTSSFVVQTLVSSILIVLCVKRQGIGALCSLASCARPAHVSPSPRPCYCSAPASPRLSSPPVSWPTAKALSPGWPVVNAAQSHSLASCLGNHHCKIPRRALAIEVPSQGCHSKIKIQKCRNISRQKGGADLGG